MQRFRFPRRLAGLRQSAYIPVNIRVQLVTREGCPLCDEAEMAVLTIFGGGQVDIVDVTSDRALEDEFVLRVPVLRAADAVLAEGSIDVATARAARRALVQRLHGPAVTRG